MQKVIFVVDDSIINLAVAKGALEYDGYLVVTLDSADKMFKALGRVRPDLILLDINMPEMDGFSAISLLKSSDIYKDIPVIFLTAMLETEIEAKGIELGAVDFVVKPFSEPVLLNRIKNHLRIDEMIRKRTEELTQRTAQLERLQNSVVFTLADIVENRDKNTGGHIARTTDYCKILMQAMLDANVYADDLRSWNLDLVASSSRLHDLGKISIPDSILNKPDKLTDEEFVVIKTHPQAGARIIEHMISRTGDADFLHHAKQFAAYHQEKWDGSGYPWGLKNLNIPLEGRIMAVVDVYDALTSERPYKKAFSDEKAVKIIENDSGTHFEPAIAGVFVDNIHKIKQNRINLAV